MGTFTREELAAAKSVDLAAVATGLGYTVRRIGNLYTIKEMDSIRIYPDHHWYRWSGKTTTGITGGSQIDFMMEFAGMDIGEAVAYLLDFSGNKRANVIGTGDVRHPVEREHKPFVLPFSASNNLRIIKYLTEERGLSEDTVQWFIEHHLIFESEPYHNVVFVGYDNSGIAKFAGMRGIYDRNGKSFKCDVAGSDKRYAFHVGSEGSDTVWVFEAGIDLMSCFELYHHPLVHMIALGMTSDNPLEAYVKDHPEICCIKLCLDNDEPGRKACRTIAEKYCQLGYRVDISGPPSGFKDYNDWLRGAGNVIKCWERSRKR